MRKHQSVYWHVGNSGVTFEVVDSGNGPTLIVKSGSFGNLNQTFEVHTTGASLAQLGIALIRASFERYSDEYVHSAVLRGRKEPQIDSSGNLVKKEKGKADPDLGTVPRSLPSWCVTDVILSAEKAALAILQASATEGRSISIDNAVSDTGLDYQSLSWLWTRGYLRDGGDGRAVWAYRESEVAECPHCAFPREDVNGSRGLEPGFGVTRRGWTSDAKPKAFSSSNSEMPTKAKPKKV